MQGAFSDRPLQRGTDASIGPLSIREAIDVFGVGYGYTRSFTHPYLFERMGPIWLLHDAPRRRGPYRSKEAIIHGLTADQALPEVQRIAPDAALCVVEDLQADHARIKASYKFYGYRLVRREPFMVRRLAELPEFDAPLPIRRVATAEDADRVAVVARTRQILREDLGSGDTRLRLYAAWQADRPVGWVRSVRTGPTTAWVSNMYVRPEFRRQGLGRALMAAMMADDARYGIRHSVLLASEAGSRLYPILGYEQIGLLQLFT